MQIPTWMVKSLTCHMGEGVTLLAFAYFLSCHMGEGVNLLAFAFCSPSALWAWWVSDRTFFSYLIQVCRIVHNSI